MAVYAQLLQLNMLPPEGTNAVFDVFFGIVDSVAEIGEATEIRVNVPLSTPGTWKESFIQAMITKAAQASEANPSGYTLPIENIRWEVTEPGDYKASFQAVNWTKDATKTNLPSSYTNIYAGAAGEGQLVNTFGCKQYRLVVHVNKVGTGTQDAALVDVSNASNVIAVSDAAVAGEHTLDSGWTDLPAWLNGGEVIVKPMAKSSVATDDPVYRQFALYLR